MSNRESDIQNLTGKILLATPSISDTYINRSMVFVCEHSNEGAMGLIINKIIPEMSFLSVISQINLQEIIGNVKVYIGGNRELDNCYILHTNKNLSENTKVVSNDIFLTVCDNMVKSLGFVSNEPERKILCLGCYHWDAMQLESEIAANYWIPIEADEALIFGDPNADKWSKAFLKIGLHSPLFLDKSGTA